MKKTSNKATSTGNNIFVEPHTKMHGALVQQKRTELKKELFRKVIHIATVFVPFALRIAYYPVIILLSLVLVMYIVSEILRLNDIQFPVISQITGAAARHRDGTGFVLGPVTLALGVIITALVFEPLPAQIGITALALGDGLSSLAGKVYGKRYIPFTKGKTLAGSITCFVAIFVSTLLIVKDVRIALIIAGTGTVIELVPIKDMDNILIPILLAFIANYLI